MTQKIKATKEEIIEAVSGLFDEHHEKDGELVDFKFETVRLGKIGEAPKVTQSTITPSRFQNTNTFKESE